MAVMMRCYPRALCPRSSAYRGAPYPTGGLHNRHSALRAKHEVKQDSMMG
jgi:hypothetical protein